MEHAASMVMEKFKGIAKSSQDFVDGLFHRRINSSRRRPIEILKRLQREAFSDLMKLRERQDKVERILSFYKTSKGSPFQEASTIVRGEVNVLAALLMMDSADKQSCEAFGRSRIRTGTDTRFTFVTNVRKDDMFLAEFAACQDGSGGLSDDLGSPLSLTKVFYLANVTDWLSAVAIPIGAQCRDIGNPVGSSHQVKGLAGFSSSGPPFLNQHSGSAIGLSVKKSNVFASLGQCVSGLRMQPESDVIRRCFSIFGQVVCQLPKGTKLSIQGLHKVPKTIQPQFDLGALSVPVGCFNRKFSETSTEGSSPSMESSARNDVAGSIALTLESEIDESKRILGWIEMNKSTARNLKWAVSVSDESDDDTFGWGMAFGGLFGHPHWNHFQVEAYTKFKWGKTFSLQPGMVYIMDGTAKMPAFVLRSGWSF